MTTMGRRSPVRGFTLIELIVVIVLLGIASAAVIRLNSGLNANASHIQDLQSNTQLLQACAERVVASRRLSGFNETAGFYDAMCEQLPTMTSAGNNFTVTTTTTSTESCPAGAVCQLVEMALNTAKGSLGPISLQWVKY